jgi:hypothetical protein
MRTSSGFQSIYKCYVLLLLLLDLFVYHDYRSWNKRTVHIILHHRVYIMFVNLLVF